MYFPAMMILRYFRINARDCCHARTSFACGVLNENAREQRKCYKPGQPAIHLRFAGQTGSAKMRAVASIIEGEQWMVFWARELR
jgi:hypothetical protein